MSDVKEEFPPEDEPIASGEDDEGVEIEEEE